MPKRSGFPWGRTSTSPRGWRGPVDSERSLPLITGVGDGESVADELAQARGDFVTTVVEAARADGGRQRRFVGEAERGQRGAGCCGVGFGRQFAFDGAQDVGGDAGVEV